MVAQVPRTLELQDKLSGRQPWRTAVPSCTTIFLPQRYNRWEASSPELYSYLFPGRDERPNARGHPHCELANASVICTVSQTPRSPPRRRIPIPLSIYSHSTPDSAGFRATHEENPFQSPPACAPPPRVRIAIILEPHAMVVYVIGFPARVRGPPWASHRL